ncbi:MAG: hypothetical protein LBB34_04115 [Holosporales bacterium]|jgi:NADH-quinone oxidoreductase subunit N|nr:hypothetical protein [Holosporales bacterium]
MLLSIKSLSWLTLTLPDVFAGASLVFLSLVNITVGERCSRTVFQKFAIVFMGVCFAITVWCTHWPVDKEFESKFFTYTVKLTYMKSVAFCFSTIALVLLNYIKMVIFNNVFYILVFGLINAITICISANNFLSLVLGLELYSFSVCFLLLVQKNGHEQKKNAVRFILTSAIMTAVLLFGISLYYFQSGCLSFSKINLDSNIASTLGITMILAVLLFKVGAPPFHSWMIDMYEKAPVILVFFLDTMWKFFVVFTIIKIFSTIIANDATQYNSVLAIISAASMIVGGVMPFFEKNIKKFIAYTSIGHIGFVSTVFVVTNNSQSMAVILAYLAFYSLASTCFFLSILFLQRHEVIETFRDVSGLIRRNIPIGLCIFVSLFSMAGFPPFAIFLAKLRIFKLLLEAENYSLLILAIIYSSMTLLYAVKCLRYLFKAENLKFEKFQGNNAFFAIQVFVQLLSVFTYGSVMKKFLWIVTDL